MDFVKSDIWILRATAFDSNKYDENNPEAEEGILFHAGTETIVDSIDGNFINLKFPNGEIHPHDPALIFQCFNRKIDDTLLQIHETIHYGTPSIKLSQYLPDDVDWRKNYRYKIIVELEDRGFKKSMCPNCLTDTSEEPIDEITQLLTCPECKLKITPLNPSEL